MSNQQHQGEQPRQPIPQMVQNAFTDETDTDIKLKVPNDPLSNSRPESPVNRKRTDDSSGQGHRHDGSSSRTSLPPTKKSKTSPPLTPTINNSNNYSVGILGSHSLNDYRTTNYMKDDATSPQTSPILEPLMPVLVGSTTEKRYSPVTDLPQQSKARKLDDNQPLSPTFRPLSPTFRVGSPPFRATSPPFRAASPTFRATSPSFGGSATSILDSFSKPGENSLGNLNLGTPVIGRTPVGERVMGVITSQPNSRQSSPDPRPSGASESKQRSSATAMATAAPTDIVDLIDMHFNADIGAKTIHEETMHTISDLEGNPHDDNENNNDHKDGGSDEEEDDDDENDALASAEEPMHPTDEMYGYLTDSDNGFGLDSMDEIDVEGMEMLDSDAESDGTPYDDPDPLCLDRFTEDESDIILEEARMHGVSYVIRKYILSGLVSTKKMLLLTIPEEIEIPDSMTENDLVRTVSERIKKFLRRRRRLQSVHTLDHVVCLLKKSKRIMLLTGAGVSVSCGIPDFRSEDGIYSRLSEFELDDPQQMFDLDFFRERPQIFYSFAREIFPSNFTPSPSHYFIKMLEDRGKLLRNYTQNIDTLEQKAGIKKVLNCHGSFATASCVRCGNQVPGDEIKDQIFKQEVAFCSVCKTPPPPPKTKKRRGYHSDDDDDDDSDDDDRVKPLMKPDIVFFGEKLPAAFHQSLKEDREEVDLLIVIGSSLKVAPVSDIMHQLPNSVPQILINRTPNYQMEFDVQLLGNCDAIVAELCRMAGWELKHEKLPGGTSNVPDMEKYTNEDGSGEGGRAAWSFVEPNLYLFEGADLEELDFALIQEKNRRAHGETTHEVEQEDEDDEGDGDDEDNGDNEDDGDEQEMTAETSRRRLPVHDNREGSSGLMDEDEQVEGNDESDQGIGAPQLFSPRHHSMAGFASGTTEPRSGSISEIQHDHDTFGSKTPISDSIASFTSLRSPTFASSSHISQHSDMHGVSQIVVDDNSNGGNDGDSDDNDDDDDGGDGEDDDDDEDAKIRAMFTEKMPKDLGEDDIDIVGYSRGPSVDLGPISEDIQEVDEDDDESSDDDNNKDNFEQPKTSIKKSEQIEYS
ncbi:NAD-dependent histone deacetylase sir2 [Entomortierella beljakovae]|nr:NAD-dependent histone deacetylase sir2 [Entomortierella beljakovae]